MARIDVGVRMGVFCRPQERKEVFYRQPYWVFVGEMISNVATLKEENAWISSAPGRTKGTATA
jgi:hypothetical protein